GSWQLVKDENPADCRPQTSNRRPQTADRRPQTADRRPQTANGILPSLRLTDIAERLECRLEGDGEIDIQGVAGIEQARPGDLTFFVNPKYAAQLRQTRGSAVILRGRRRGGTRAMHT